LEETIETEAVVEEVLAIDPIEAPVFVSALQLLFSHLRMHLLLKAVFSEFTWH
jgi:hypothetical protein